MVSEAREKYGIALLDAGDYGRARDQFQLALEGSDSGSVYLGLGTAEYLLGHRSAALGPIEKAVYRWPSHQDAWRVLLRVCAESDREAWLRKAERFLRAGEMKVLEQEIAGVD